MSFLIAHPDLEGRQKVVPEHTLATYAARGWVLVDQVADGPAASAAPTLQLPKKSGSAAEWHTYAVATGDFAIVESFAKTRDELVEHYYPATDGDGGAAAAGDTGQDADGLPARNASTEVWRSYAVEHGVTEDQAQQLGRDELIAHFTAKES